MTQTSRAHYLETMPVAGVLGWMYGPTMGAISLRWYDTPEYSHGWLIPAFALWFACTAGMTRPLREVSWSGLGLFAIGLACIVAAPQWDQSVTVATIGTVAAACGASLCLPLPVAALTAWNAVGLGLLLLGGGAFIAGAYYFVDWLSAAALLPILWGLALIRCGRASQRTLWLAIGFLIFMIPLPFSVETAMREPLRAVSTKLSTYVLQALGFPCVSEGFVILIGESRIGVTEACSGLSMLMVFAALIVGCILLIRRPLWYRALLFASWPVIAIAANVFRIVTTGGLFAFGFEKLADVTYHDLAGLAMMPVGLAMLGLEMWYLDHLFVVDREQRLGPLLATIPAAPLPPRLDAPKALTPGT